MSKSKSGSQSNYDPAMLKERLGPLGLLPSFEASSGVKERLEKLDKFSLDREMQLLREDNDFQLEDRMIPTLAREFKRFMSLGLLFPQPKYNFVPSRVVDRIWHELILDTRRYHAICMDTHGTFVHHNPLDPEQIAKYAGEVIGYTKECLVAAYGAITPSIWGGRSLYCHVSSGCDYLVCNY